MIDHIERANLHSKNKCLIVFISVSVLLYNVVLSKDYSFVHITRNFIKLFIGIFNLHFFLLLSTGMSG
jgi:hypothetical protein